MNAPLPPNEARRLEVLRGLGILDTPPEPAFDDITALAAEICGTPISLISLIDADRQWIKSGYGFEQRQLPREQAFCAHALHSDELLVVPDARADARFADNPLVRSEPGVRCYAAAPLLTDDGVVLGTLCVIDRVPRRLEVHQLRALRVLGRQVVTHLQLRRDVHDLQRAEAALLGIMEDQMLTEQALRRSEKALHDSEERWQFALVGSDLGVWDWNVVSGEVFFSERLATMLDYAPAEIGSRIDAWIAFVHPDDIAATQARLGEHFAGTMPVYIDEYRVRAKDGGYRWILSRGLVMSRDATGRPLRMVGTHTDISERKRGEQRQAWEAQVLETISSGQPLEAVLGQVVRGIEELLGGAGASVCLLDGDSGKVQRVVARHLGADVAREVESPLLVEDSAACDGAAQGRRLTLVADIETDPRCAGCRATARAHGLRACWSMPVTEGKGRVLATCAVFHSSPRTPQKSDLQFLERAAQILRLAIERERNDRALRASEERFRRTFSDAATGIAVTDRDGRLVQVNAAYCRMLGYTEAELQAADFAALTHADDRQRLADLDRDVLLGRRDGFVDELRYVARAGGTVWARISASAWRDAGGQPAGIVRVAEDITQQKLAEDELRQSQALLRMASHVSRLGAWAVDLPELRLTASDEARAIFELPQDAPATVRTALAACAPEHRAALRAAIDACIGDGRPFDFELQIDTARGHRVWVRAIGEVVRDALGRITRVQGAIQDISQAKEAEQSLRASEQRFRLLSSAASDAIWDWNRIDDTFWWSEGLETLFGYRRDEVEPNSQSWIGRIHPDDRRRVVESVEGAIELGQDTWSNEYRFGRKDGSYAFVVDRGRVIRDAAGRAVRMVGGMTDISERRQIDEELARYRLHLERLVNERTAQLEEARRQAEAANAAKSAFLANMSHEIRTPMNGVLGMVDVLAQTRLSEQQAEMLRTIRDSGSTLLGIIDDILDLSKIEAGRLKVELAPVSVADVAEGLCDSLVPVAERSAVDLTVFVEPRIPERVLGDAVRLRQMLYNLIGNAIKFSAGNESRRGRVALRVTVAQQTPLRLAFAVVDNGIGMSAETVGRLFSPFTQAEASTTRRFGGTGLGLTIVKRLTDLLGGAIDVASEPGRGSTFALTLPFSVPPVQPAVSLPDLTGVLCVLLDSADADLDGCAAYLECAGATVRRAGDDEALVRLAAATVGLVVAIRHIGLAPPGRVTVPERPNLRHLLLTRGRRRRARAERSNVVSLDGAALRRAALLRAVAIAAGRASFDIDHEGSAPTHAAATPGIAEARDRGELILVAEDDEVNRKVIVRQLEILGRRAEIAPNGAEALRMWRAGRYALLLTDLHMPELDGYALARTIRREELTRGDATAGGRHMPIIALTANALRGEADNARAAGMDDYLTKPLQLESLRKVVDHWLGSAGAAGTAAAARPLQELRSGKQAMDISVLMRLVGDDQATLREFLVLYRQTAARTLDELRSASNAGDAHQAGAIAHKLKSSSRSIGATALGDLCAEIELLGKAGDSAAIRQRMTAFEAAMQEVEQEIDALLDDRRRQP